MRGPSSSAARTRCHCPSTSSPAVTWSVRLWPRSIARRWASALLRSQSECSGSLCIQLPCSRHGQLEELLDVGVKRRLVLVDEDGTRRVERPEADEAFLDAGAVDHARDPLGQVDELHALGGLKAQGLGVDDEAAGREGHVAGGCLPGADGRALTHRLQSSYGHPECGRKSLILQVLYCRAQLTTEPRPKRCGSARRPREVGANPTRCRHCKRGVLFPCGFCPELVEG